LRFLDVAGENIRIGFSCYKALQLFNLFFLCLGYDGQAMVK